MSNEFKFNKEKFKDVVSYIISRCESKPNVDRTVLYNLLYFSDFNFYEIYERPLTNEFYLKHENGPCPIHFEELLKDMIGNNELKIINNVNKDNYDGIGIKVLLKKFDLTSNEINIIDNVVDKLGDYNALELSNYSLNDTPCAVAKCNGILNYEFVFYRDDEYSVRIYDEK